MRLVITGGMPLLRHGLALQLCAGGYPAPEEREDLTVSGRPDAVLVLAPAAEGPRAVPGVLEIAACAPTLVLTDAPARWRATLAAVQAVAGAPGATVLALSASPEDVLTWVALAVRPAGPAPVLTTTERGVWALLAEGLSNAAIAERLGVSPRTVECHVSHLFSKLGLSRDDGVNARVTAARTWLVRTG